ncbi:hypothetical protein [Halalkalibacter urbisdiaboli]|uniref:hypothetical protein n=1 Tax=Halalkalibacter urbisdiaboli TaxID=1960589 RepID=UPI000B43BDB9|nr:hypothetical protein [Halalkalibacter urbisdiaboli]
MQVEFIYNKRLGISLPQLYVNWEDLDTDSQARILAEWEIIRGQIPDKVKKVEETINHTLAALTTESDFERSCELNLEMAELASIINDLWIWFRVDPTVSSVRNEKPVHA